MMMMMITFNTGSCKGNHEEKKRKQKKEAGRPRSPSSRVLWGSSHGPARSASAFSPESCASHYCKLRCAAFSCRLLRATRCWKVLRHGDDVFSPHSSDGKEPGLVPTQPPSAEQRMGRARCSAPAEVGPLADVGRRSCFYCIVSRNATLLRDAACNIYVPAIPLLTMKMLNCVL